MRGFESYLPEESFLVRQILWKRAFSEEEARSFLEPRLADLPSPETLKDLPSALSLLLQARDRKEAVLIYGDYDVDGSTATTVLVRGLRDLGWTVEFFIPRRIEEGYGLSLEGAKRVCEDFPQCRLIVTVDCGISSFEGIQYLKSQSRKVIVTDHHNVPAERVPAEAVINPKQKDCAFPEKNLAGVGVAFFLLAALRKALGAKDYSLRPLLAYVALGSLCDMVELKGANRILVKHGLDVLARTDHPGLKALKQVAQCDRPVFRSADAGFGLGPRINAVGRVGNPRLATELLLSRDFSEALRKALELDAMNSQRREMQAEQVALALEKIQNQNEAAWVVADPKFHLGIVGLIASQLTKQTQKVACVLAPIEDEHLLADFPEFPQRVWKGSLRGLKGVHLAKLLESLREEHPELLLSAGGHAMAAGVSLLESEIENFRRLFVSRLAQEAPEPAQDLAECELLSTEGLEEFFDKMEPFGQGNPAPKWLLKGFQLEQVQILKERHLKLWGVWKGQRWPVLQFQSPWVSLFEGFREGAARRELDFVVELSENFWGGERSFQLRLSDWIALREDGKFYGSDEIGARSNEIRQSAAT